MGKSANNWYHNYNKTGVQQNSMYVLMDMFEIHVINWNRDTYSESTVFTCIASCWRSISIIYLLDCCDEMNKLILQRYFV